MSESSKHSENTSDIEENDDNVYTHPIVTEKKGYTNLTDYERNYRDMERRAKHVQNSIGEESKEPKVHDDQSKKKKDDTNVPKSFTNENDREKYVEEPKATTSKITEKNGTGKIDTLTNTKNKLGNVSMDNSRKMDDLKDDSNTSELTDISPEEAYVRHLERIIAANALPPRNIQILKDLYARYTSNKKYASTIEETRAETGNDTSDVVGESKTDTRDQIENAPIHDNKKPILDPSLKESNDVIRSSTQEVSKNSVLTESSTMNDEKSGSLENTDLFANNDEILTSTPKTSKDNISSSSNLDNIKNICDVTNMTIESPFSDFSLQKVKIKSGLRDLNIIKEEDNEDVNLTGINQNQATSSSVSSSQYPTSLDTSKNVELSHQQSVLKNKTKRVFLTEDDLVCRCPQIEVDTISNENNNVESITDRIRRYFLSLLMDYWVPRQIRTSKSKVPCT